MDYVHNCNCVMVPIRITSWLQANCVESRLGAPGTIMSQGFLFDLYFFYKYNMRNTSFLSHVSPNWTRALEFYTAPVTSPPFPFPPSLLDNHGLHQSMKLITFCCKSTIILWTVHLSSLQTSVVLRPWRKRRKKDFKKKKAKRKKVACLLNLRQPLVL